MSNIVMIWLDLLRHGSNLQRVAELYEGRPQTPQCPTILLYGAKGSDELYCDPLVRPALDGWDVGRITSFDIARWAKWILNGEKYDDHWRAESHARHKGHKGPADGLLRGNMA